MFVMHPGHENKGRPAGSYQLLGSADFVLRIAVDAADTAIALPLDSQRTLTLEKAKDSQSGITLGHFSMREVEVWQDEDGEPVTSCVVVEALDAAKPTARKEKLPKNQQTMFTILHAAGAQGLELKEWNARAREAGLGTNRKADLTDYRMALHKRGLIFEGAHGWFAKRKDSG